MKKTMRYKFFRDWGHGWLRVPVDHLLKLGIINAITPYSYINGSWAYLEEDCDYGTFVAAWERWAGIQWLPSERVEFASAHKREPQNSRIRTYDHYPNPQYKEV